MPEREAELEMMVAVLSAGLGLNEPLTSIPDVVLDSLERGDDEAAVRALRQAVPDGLRLLAAKRMVDELKRVPD